jgi:serine/threonine-protein kinase HipA
MSVSELCLLLGDELAGTVTRLSNGKLTFRYDEGYISRGGAATPISVSMPTQIASHTDSQITPWLWGLLPDNDAVLNRWSREFHVSASSAFGLLATPLGLDCPGAIRLIPPGNLSAREEPNLTDVDWLSEAQIAQRLRDLKRDNTTWLGANHAGRFSLAGAQAKTALLRAGDRWGDPRGATATSHILKPAVEGLDNHNLNEHLCLAAMRVAGLLAVRSSIERFEDQSAIVVARYDRLVRDGLQLRIHQEDLCQALGVHPARKYQNEGGPGPREIAALFRRIMPRADAHEATTQLLDALVWNWIIAGTDAHAKNYSLLLLGSQVRLAPFYDVASALPYDSIPEQKLRLAMKFGTGYLVNPAGSPWKRLASDLQLPEDEVRAHASHLIAAAPDAFTTAAADPAVRALNNPLPAHLTDLIAQRTTRCAKYL